MSGDKKDDFEISASLEEEDDLEDDSSLDEDEDEDDLDIEWDDETEDLVESIEEERARVEKHWEMIKKVLKIQVAEEEIDSGSVPVTWCLDSEYLGENRDKLNEFWIHICTFHKSVDGRLTEWRAAPARLTDKMTYATFLRSGENRIAAIIASSRIFRWKDPHFDVVDYPVSCCKSNPEYDYKFWDYFLRRYYCPHAYLDVDVPSEVFANPPWKWEERWVNLFLDGKPTDQCSFRRRRIFAYTVQPIVFLTFYLIKILMFILAYFAGFIRNNPFSTGIKNPFIDCGGPFYIDEGIEWSDSLFWRKNLPTFFNLVNVTFFPILFIIGVLGWIGLFGPNLGLYLFAGFLAFGIGVYAIPVIGMGFVGVVYYLSNFILFKIVLKLFKLLGGERAVSFVDKFAHSHIETREEDRLERDFELLSCDSGAPCIRRMEDLPKEKRTLSLRFKGIKSRVCRPFSR